MIPIKRVKLRGKSWDVVETTRAEISGVGGLSHHERVDGLTEAPDSEAKRIFIAEETKGERRLDTLIHEALHACFWDLAEESISTAARDIAHMLWRIGYRVGQ